MDFSIFSSFLPQGLLTHFDIVDFKELGEFFYHTNVKTPQWIGYIFQRPEMHRIHHEYDKYTNNYGDIVWWDMLFGTYENPKEFKANCGFDNEKEQRLLDMLKFKDVHKE